ncbi:restriction endonuclease subunit S [Lacticaseibacillus rhamnosus]|nr:restriction endonuclease subunit S [Lacticaseibacillus rhamnosus]MCU7654062.1 restriction endonuclease subunit S [Lacticaseibacillus rhamnosus]MCZ2748558.1 restriction endonuclease subunit S [Lacticaseibacillus rhamnosus]MCZ2756451.1 restriction endonuclease subunit S [Lacticaseibacillus rhamnosus]MCZ2759064.1 restriction endonuclease subunit S [Lacticaseibacillus rhamnosus]MDB7660721.1 restriction endonuclease subunit S [Lacticaseibacillus rhamnosus]
MVQEDSSYPSFKRLMTPIFYPINAWEKRKFGDLYSKTSEKNDGSFGPDKIISVATMSWKTNVRISSEDYLATYNVLRKGDIAFEGNKSKKFSFGRFVENDIGDGIVSHVFVVFRPKVSPIISYWKYFIHNEFVMRNILRKSTIKATMMTNLSSHDFLRQTLCTPSFKEQENIGNFLERLDSLIAATQGKLDNLEKIKRALLKHLFDQSMRFRGYSDPWEKRKFGELYKPNKERNESAEFSSENTLSIATMTVNRKGNGAAKTSLLKYKVIRIGDIAFEGHTSKKFAFGRFVLNDVADGIMSPRFTCLRPIHRQIIQFWKQYIHYEPILRPILIRSTKLGTMMNELVVPDLLKQNIRVPSINEQKLIGKSLSRVDDLIAATQSKLSSLETLKKALLQGLFI